MEKMETVNMDFSDQVKISSFILLSLAVCVITTYFLRKRIHKKHEQIQNKNYSFYSIIPEIGLFELPLFWIPISLTGTFSLCLSITISFQYDIKISQDGFNLFLDIVQLPALIIAICIPISAAIARAHSTKQTAEVINREHIKFNRLEQKSHKKDYFDIYDSTDLTLTHPYDKERSKTTNAELGSYNYFYEVKENSIPIIIENNILDILRIIKSLTESSKKLRPEDIKEDTDILYELSKIFKNLNNIKTVVASGEIGLVLSKNETLSFYKTEKRIVKFQKLKLYDIHYCIKVALSYITILLMFDERINKKTYISEQMQLIDMESDIIIISNDLSKEEEKFRRLIDQEIDNRISNNEKPFNLILKIPDSNINHTVK